MAARNQKNRRPKKKKNKRKTPFDAPHARLVQNNLGIDLPPKVVINPPGHEKMSEVILEFAKPLLDRSPNDGATRAAIEFAIIAWNLAVLKGKGGEKTFEEVMREMMKSDTDEFTLKIFRPFLEILFQRKRELFPDNQRMILNYEFTRTRDDLQLNVTSVPLTA